MRFLNFQTKTPPAANTTWQTHYNSILSLLENCSIVNQLNQIHAKIIRTSLTQNTFLASRLIAFFSSPSPHFNIVHARRIFDQIDRPNLFIWNSIIRGYNHNNTFYNALLLYKQMLFRGYSPDSYTYPIVIKSCSQLHALELGKTIHGQVMRFGFESNMLIVSVFLTFYSSCERVEVARKLFDEMSERDVVSWTRMISAYAQLNCSDEALLLFNQMRREGVEPNNVTVASLLSACGNARALDRGRWVHSYIVNNKMELDVVIGNALLDMYTKCGCMSSALEVFHNISAVNTDTISWNILIGGYTQNGLPTEALMLFREMEKTKVRPNEITLVNTLSACAQLADLEEGKLLNAYIAENAMCYGAAVSNALINMYSKCGDLEEAKFVFHEMRTKDVFSWTALIAGYVQESKFKEALTLFEEMRLSGVEPNEVTLVSLLTTCSQLGALEQGKWIHDYILDHKMRQHVALGTALIDMYMKCGCVARAVQIFHSMPQKDNFTWNALIGGLAMHGHGREAVILFSQMQMLGDVIPDRVTFMTLLCACTHSGLVREGYDFFNSMSALYGIEPSIEHYGCMVDLLGRAGHLEEAVEFIEKMPVEPNHVIWATLLSACCVYRKVDLGEKVAHRYIKLAPDDEGVYVLISNLYAEAGRWDDVRKVRSLMDNRRIEKSPGCSLVEIDGVIQEFHVRGLMHNESTLIYITLDNLMLQSKEVVFKSSEYEAF